MIYYISYFRTLKRFLIMLREQHLGVWDALGRPNVDASISAYNSFMTVKFLLRNGYSGLDDIGLEKLGIKARRQLIACWLLFLLMVATAMIGQL